MLKAIRKQIKMARALQLKVVRADALSSRG